MNRTKDYEKVFEQIHLAFGATKDDLISKRKNGLLPLYRHIFCKLCLDYGYTQEQIGEILGGRDHSTISNSKLVLKGWLEINDKTAVDAMKKINSVI